MREVAQLRTAPKLEPQRPQPAATVQLRSQLPRIEARERIGRDITLFFVMVFAIIMLLRGGCLRSPYYSRSSSRPAPAYVPPVRTTLDRELERNSGALRRAVEDLDHELGSPAADEHRQAVRQAVEDLDGNWGSGAAR